ncbi:MAG: polyphosphate kinase 2 family protein [Vicinamibacteraceae bacterium]|nr:polyphosphate kinase 2 family protein [Vicinamibacteraceae bacterium]
MARRESLIERYRITRGRKFRLKDIDPGDTHEITSKAQAEALLQEGVDRLSDLQEKLYAQDRWGILCIFQAMDAAGKDGTIKHVMSGVNPQGCQVSAFKVPSAEELDHDFLWRTTRHLPERGRIGIFNRSYYEETLVVRVHPEFLERQRLPPPLVTRRIWKERYEDINCFERYLTRNGFVILKFFLHVSKDEQLRRFVSRLDEPEKHWKFSLGDVHERAHWDDYMAAYEQTIRATATPHAPWFVIPADHKWFTRLVVSAAIVDALESLDLHFPRVDQEKRRELEAARASLVGDAGDVADTVVGLAPARQTGGDDDDDDGDAPEDGKRKGKKNKKKSKRSKDTD